MTKNRLEKGNNKVVLLRTSFQKVEKLLLDTFLLEKLLESTRLKCILDQKAFWKVFLSIFLFFESMII